MNDPCPMCERTVRQRMNQRFVVFMTIAVVLLAMMLVAIEAFAFIYWSMTLLGWG